MSRRKSGQRPTDVVDLNDRRQKVEDGEEGTMLDGKVARIRGDLNWMVALRV